MINKCPNSIEELEELEQLLPLCRKELYVQAKAKVDSGNACSLREASRQLGEEIGRKPESIRRSVQREVATVSPPLGGTSKYTPKKVNEEIVRLAKEITKEKKEVKQQERLNSQIERDKQFKPIPLPDKKYSVLYLDPPWRYEYSVSHSRDIENQYPTMALDEIKALEIPADENCIMFMWATSPKLFEAFEVLQAWEFTYKTCAVWLKDKIGLGYYFRQQHELLLVATRGTPVLPAPADRISSVLEYPRLQHSAKPKEIYDIIDNMYPGIVKLEMFSRGNDRKLWNQWGNEVE